MLPPGASEASSSESSSRCCCSYHHSSSFVVLVAFRLSFFFFSEEFYLTRLFQRVFVSLISLSISLRVCACKAETNIMSIIAPRLPREGKNARKCVVLFVFVLVRALLSRSSRIEVVRSSFFDLVVLSSHMRDI